MDENPYRAPVDDAPSEHPRRRNPVVFGALAAIAICSGLAGMTSVVLVPYIIIVASVSGRWPMPPDGISLIEILAGGGVWLGICLLCVAAIRRINR